MRSLAALVLVAALPGCTLYFTDDDDGGDGWSDDGPCAYPAGEPRPDIAEPNYELRNPETGICESFGYPGPYPCDDRCGPCPVYEDQQPIAPPDWAQCWSSCEGLGELDCQGTDGCRAAYTTDGNDGPESHVFQGCWAVAPSGPVRGGDCSNLGAYECSQHDDCSPVHSDAAPYKSEPVPPVMTSFLYCIEETASGCYSDDECAVDETCTADTECLPPPGCGRGQDCPAVCYGRCIPVEAAACEAIVEELACQDRGDCVTVYIGEDCECTPGTCSCETLTFDRCATR